MNVATMMSQLGTRLIDSGTNRINNAAKLSALRNAQNTTAMLLENSFLTELETLETSLTATGGEYSISSLDNGVNKGSQGILRVKIHGGRWCKSIDLMSMDMTDNTLLSGTVNDPLYYVFANTIYVSNGQTNPVIDVYYIKTPTVLRYSFTSDEADSGSSTTKFDGAASEGLSAVDDTYNGAVIYNETKETYHVVTDYDGGDLEFTVSPAAAAAFPDGETFLFDTNSFDQINLAGVTTDLNITLHDIILDIAESELWSQTEQAEKVDKALNRGIAKIQALNASVKPADIKRRS